jgi:hypothetical protein
MKMNIPVIGLVPDIVPSWMNEDNGVWVNNKTILTDVISDFIQNWLEDNINPALYENMKKTTDSLNTKEKFESSVVELFNRMIMTRLEGFENQLNKLQTVE